MDRTTARRAVPQAGKLGSRPSSQREATTPDMESIEKRLLSEPRRSIQVHFTRPYGLCLFLLKGTQYL
jgi:hypothetical protein